MSQKELELILARHLASHLALPVFVADASGNLVYYNEEAGVVLGPYEDAREIPLHERLRALEPRDEAGAPVPPEEMPLAVALAQKRPVHRILWIKGLDGISRHIEATAFPLIGYDERCAGAVSLFWKASGP